jgi:hypothetical protein
MFNPTLIVIEAFIGELRTMHERTYGMLESGYPGISSTLSPSWLLKVSPLATPPTTM